MDHPTWTRAETEARVRGSLRDTFPDMFGAAGRMRRRSSTTPSAACISKQLTPLPGAGRAAARAGRCRSLSRRRQQQARPSCAWRPSSSGWDRHFRQLAGAGMPPATSRTASTSITRWVSGARQGRADRGTRCPGSSAMPMSTWSARAMPAAAPSGTAATAHRRGTGGHRAGSPLHPPIFQFRPMQERELSPHNGPRGTPRGTLRDTIKNSRAQRSTMPTCPRAYPTAVTQVCRPLARATCRQAKPARCEAFNGRFGDITPRMGGGHVFRGRAKRGKRHRNTGVASHCLIRRVCRVGGVAAVRIVLICPSICSIATVRSGRFALVGNYVTRHPGG